MQKETRARPIPFSGGNLLNYALASPLNYTAATGTLSVQKRLGADDATVIPQWSINLINWHDTEFQFEGSEPLQWTHASDGRRKFFRLLIQ